MLGSLALACCCAQAAREARICEIGEGITALWARLKTPEAEQQAWLESHSGLGNGVIAAVRPLAGSLVTGRALGACAWKQC